MSALRALARPRTIIALLIAATLLAFAFSLGQPRTVLSSIAALPHSTLWLTAAAAAVYLCVKAALLRLLLDKLDVVLHWHEFALAFCLGELTVTLPFGIFSQNWSMSASSGIRVARTTPATLMMLLAEALVALLVLAVLGIPGWSALRPAAATLAVVFVATILAAPRFAHVATRLADRVHRRALRKIVDAAIEVLENLACLSRPRLLAISVVLAAVYLAALSGAFFNVGTAMQVHGLDYLRAVTIYAFALVVVLFGSGAVGQVGTLDVLGMMVARSWGIDYDQSLALMLGFRVVWTLAIWLFTLPFVLALRPLLVRRRRRRSGSGKH